MSSQRKHFRVRPFICTRCHDRYEFDTDTNGSLFMRCRCKGWRQSIMAPLMSPEAIASQTKKGNPRI